MNCRTLGQKYEALPLALRVKSSPAPEEPRGSSGGATGQGQVPGEGGFAHTLGFLVCFFANVFTTCLVRCRHDRARPEGNTDRCVKRQPSILTSSRTAAQNVHLEGMRRARNTTRALALALALWLQSATLARTSAGRHAGELETRQRVCAVWLSSKHRHQSDLCRVQEQPVY